MKFTPAVWMIVASGLTTGASTAQSLKADTSAKITDLEVNLMRQDLRDQKKQVVAANLPLNGEEAAAFWPLYGAYTDETIKVNDRRYALVKDYAGSYNTMTDQQAADYIRQWIEVDQAATQLRLDWIPKFEKVLGNKKAAMFFQIDRRVGLMMEIQLASQLPLVKP